MNQKFDENTAIKTLRWQGIYCTAMMVFFIAMGLFSFVLGHDASSDRGLMVLFVIVFLVTFIGPTGSALSTVSAAFRSQQSEFENLKAAVERLQSRDFPVESKTAPHTEGVTTTLSTVSQPSFVSPISSPPQTLKRSGWFWWGLRMAKMCLPFVMLRAR